MAANHAASLYGGQYSVEQNLEGDVRLGAVAIHPGSHDHDEVARWNEHDALTAVADCHDPWRVRIVTGAAQVPLITVALKTKRAIRDLRLHARRCLHPGFRNDLRAAPPTTLEVQQAELRHVSRQQAQARRSDFSSIRIRDPFVALDAQRAEQDLLGVLAQTLLRRPLDDCGEQHGVAAAVAEPFAGRRYDRTRQNEAIAVVRGIHRRLAVERIAVRSQAFVPLQTRSHRQHVAQANAQTFGCLQILVLREIAEHRRVEVAYGTRRHRDAEQRRRDALTYRAQIM